MSFRFDRVTACSNLFGEVAASGDYGYLELPPWLSAYNCIDSFGLSSRLVTIYVSESNSVLLVYYYVAGTTSCTNVTNVAVVPY
jgi:hypothetical protein